MKRTGFARKGPPPRPAKTLETYTPRPRAAAVAVADTRTRMVVPVPKREYLRDEFYRRWVASLPCAHCGIEGYSQAAHGDQGKGMGIKSSDDTCYPACGPHLDFLGMVQGCHALLGSTGTFTKQQRRDMERQYAQQTRALWAQKGKD